MAQAVEVMAGGSTYAGMVDLQPCELLPELTFLRCLQELRQLGLGRT
jgi:hypothetical protein